MRRPKLLSSIAWRITLGFSLLAGVIFLSVALVIHAAAAHHFESQDRQAWEGKLELIGHLLEGWQSPDDAASVHALLADAMVGHHSLLVRVEDPASEFRFVSGHAPIPALDADTPPTGPSARAFEPIAWAGAKASFRGLVTRVPTGQRGHAMQVTVASDTSRHAQILREFDYQLALVFGVALLVMASLAWLTTRRGLSPIDTMARVAESISAHHLHERLAASKVPIELQPLADAFNAMLDRLSESLQRLTDFSSDLAHELRTPISNLLMQTQVSLSKPRSAEEYREVLYSSLEEYEHVARMIGDMLFLAKADHGLIIPHREAIALEEEIGALFEFYEALAAERGVRLARHGSGCIQGDRVMVRRAVGNLLTNAIRYTPRAGEIRVEVLAGDENVAVCVENPGPTIPPEQIVRLFNRFYRGSPSRQRVDEGAGLGLAICQSIVRAHGGDVSVVSHAGSTRFVLAFPREASETATAA